MAHKCLMLKSDFCLTNQSFLPLLQQVCGWHFPLCAYRGRIVSRCRQWHLVIHSLWPKSLGLAYLLSPGCVTNTFLILFSTVSFSRGSPLSKKGRVVVIVRTSFLENPNTYSQGQQGSFRMLSRSCVAVAWGTTGATTWNASGSFLRCHGDGQGSGSV